MFVSTAIKHHDPIDHVSQLVPRCITEIGLEPLPFEAGPAQPESSIWRCLGNHAAKASFHQSPERHALTRGDLANFAQQRIGNLCSGLSVWEHRYGHPY